MKLSPEQTRAAIAAGKIGAITLDTDIFDRNGRNLERGLLPRLEQFRAGPVCVLLSEIVRCEVLAHLIQDARESASALKSALEKMQRSWAADLTETSAILASTLGHRTPEEVSRKRLDEYCALVRAQPVAVDESPIMASVVDRYFGTRPPFEPTGSKKREFPDAIALLSLEAWAHQRGTIVLVVCNDDGWLKFCEESDALTAVKDLKEALSWFQSEAAEHAVQLIARDVSRTDTLGIVAAVREAMELHVDAIEWNVLASSDLSFEEDRPQAEVLTIDESVLRDEDSYVLVEGDEETLVVSITVPVTFNVSCSFSFAKWDGADREYINFGDGSATTQATEEVTFMLFVYVSNGKWALDRVTVNNDTATVEFGEVEPDWMNDGYEP